MQAHDPVAAVQATQLAIKHALAGQPGPVAVLFAMILLPARWHRIPADAVPDPLLSAARAAAGRQRWVGRRGGGMLAAKSRWS